MEANANMDFGVLKDEIELYILGIISKDELFDVLNKKRREYGFEELKEFPKELDKFLRISTTMINQVLDQFE